MFGTASNYVNQLPNFFQLNNLTQNSTSPLPGQELSEVSKCIAPSFELGPLRSPKIWQYPFLWQRRLPSAELMGLPKLRRVRSEAGSISFINCMKAAALIFGSYLWHHVTFPMKIENVRVKLSFF